MDNIFQNYENIKLSIIHPNRFYFIMVFVFIIFAIIISKKNNSHKLLDISHTTQLKGVGIFFVMFHHLFVHVSNVTPKFMFSGYVICTFLILSGFGLTVSTERKKLDYKSFFSKKIYRIMIPYWIATIIILILDFILLGRVLSFDKAILTFLGINISTEQNHLDYVRWFVTFLLLWYVIFFIVQSYFKKPKRPYIYVLFSFILLPLNYYFLPLPWNSYFAFPVGCIIAIYYKDIVEINDTKNNLILGLSVIGFICAIIFKIILGVETINYALYDIFPSIFLKFLIEFSSLILNICFIFISANFFKKGFESKLLYYLGRYSYELMLLHGLLLIKFNPILKGQNDTYNFIGFIILTSIVFWLSTIYSKFTKVFYFKRKS